MAHAINTVGIDSKRCVIGLADRCADNKRRLIERHGAANANHDGATIVVEQDRCQTTCGNSRHKRFCANCRVADSDSVGLASHTDVGDIILLLPVLASLRASQPTAIFLSAVLFIRRALSPIATLQSPLTLLMSVSLPTAELLLPVSLLSSVKYPT